MTKISDLGEITQLDGDEEFVVSQTDSTTKKIGVANIGLIDSWIPDAPTWTRVSNTQFTVAGDRTGTFTKGTRLKVTDTTTKYFVVTALPSFGGGITSVTISGGSEYLLAADPTARWFSYAVGPPGYPTSFAWNGTYTGWTVQPTGLCRFAIFGHMVKLWHGYSGTTSNSTSTIMTLPAVVAATNTYFAIRYQNNGTHATTPGMGEFSTGTSNVYFYTGWAGAGWTASGLKAMGWEATYLF